MFYTSYFGNLRNIPDHVVPVAICLNKPASWNGFHMPKVAPLPYMIASAKQGNTELAAKDYRELLSRLDADEVIEEAIDLTESEDIVFVCYEKPEDWCHRHEFAKWLSMRGYKCIEWKNYNC